MDQKPSSPPASSSDLPPARTKRPLKRVSPPLANTRLTSLIYILAGLSCCFLAFYAYRIVQWKTDVGGWWNLALGKGPTDAQRQTGQMYQTNGQSQSQHPGSEHDLESRISDLAEILGIKPTNLASAISSVVKEHTPPKTFSSLSSSASAAKAEKTAVHALFGVNGAEVGVDEGGGAAQAVVDALGSMVGMDEPVELD